MILVPIEIIFNMQMRSYLNKLKSEASSSSFFYQNRANTEEAFVGISKNIPSTSVYDHNVANQHEDMISYNSGYGGLITP